MTRGTHRRASAKRPESRKTHALAGSGVAQAVWPVDSVVLPPSSTPYYPHQCVEEEGDWSTESPTQGPISTTPYECAGSVADE